MQRAMAPIPDPPCGLRFQADVVKLFAERDEEPGVSFRVLPVDPKEVLSADNAVCQLCRSLLEVSAQSAAVDEVVCTAKLGTV
mmetsp:Transcript_16069/g.31750  ORF Transcript_16069/g.31750 Transcript_16069/m.31750 type:complete len:83 (-) Transcript_16069:564-812(-)